MGRTWVIPVLVGSACGHDVSTVVDAPPAPLITVAFSWHYFTSTTHCPQSPCGTEHDCSQAASIKQDDLSKLVTDYPVCSLVMTSPITYTLNCGGSAVWWCDPLDNCVLDAGTQVKYTGERSCLWSPPYAIP